MALRPRPAALRQSLLLGAAKVQCRHKSNKPTKAAEKMMLRASDDLQKEGDKRWYKYGGGGMTEMLKKAYAEYFKDGAGPLFPGTFVAAPFSRYPKGVSNFFKYSRYRLRQFGIEYLSLLKIKLDSMPDWKTRPKWKIARSKIAPTVKNMYMELLRAFAAGDRDTVKELCLKQYGSKLLAALDRRHPNERVTFELVKFNHTWVYPRVMAHQVHKMNVYDNEHDLEQAVVAIASTQKVARYKKSTGELIPGTTKVQKMMEYVVVSRQVNKKTFKVEPWRIWGTIYSTTLEAYVKEEERLLREQAKQAGWKGPVVGGIDVDDIDVF
ncbi:hypothetical protein IL306_010664 [Fusarium sp. DS 682]|nr:hypothetical protein IL306_010664 [Fusarium sp. DS 682]